MHLSSTIEGFFPALQISYASSRTRADAPPPPLQTPATPILPPFSLRTCQEQAKTILIIYIRNYEEWNHTCDVPK
jgi:hypothetical protein